MKNRDVRVTVLNIVIVILAIILLVLVSITVETVREPDYISYNGEYTFIYCMEDENYGNMARYYYQNCGSARKEDAELQEYYGVAKYFEAAFFHKAHMEAGDTVRADKYKAAMDAAAAQMGEFAFVADKIDKQLGE